MPDEIADDYEVVAENFAKIAEGLQDLDLGSGGDAERRGPPKLQELTASLDSAEVREASENISAWAERELLTERLGAGRDVGRAPRSPPRPEQVGVRDEEPERDGGERRKPVQLEARR